MALICLLWLTITASPANAAQQWDAATVQTNLRAHVSALASDIGQRNHGTPDNYHRAAAYITTQLTRQHIKFQTLRLIPEPPAPPIIVASFGPAPEPFPAKTTQKTTSSSALPHKVTPGSAAGVAAPKSPPSAPDLLLCAHYDTVPNAPGANDNASGVAALLELARLLNTSPSSTSMQIVFFPNEEEPYFMTPASGSFQYAKHLAAQSALPRRVVAVDSVGWTTKDAGWRVFMRFSDGNLTVGARPQSQNLAQALAMALNTATETQTVVTKDGAFWIDKSDHAPFAAQGCESALLTAPGTLAYPCLHQPCDTAEKLDYETMENTVRGLLRFCAQ